MTVATTQAGAYRGRPVLVIGGLGFIGINLVTALIDAGARVTVLTPSCRRRAEAASAVGAQGGVILEGDVREHEAVARAVAGQQTVFNLAGQSGAALSMQDPFTDLDVNCRGTLTLLEALRAGNPEAKLVYPGSRLQYGRTGPDAVSEEHAMAALCMHGAHKAAVERYVAIYRNAYRLRATVVRITNPYGPGQPFDQRPYGIVNRMIQLAMEGRPIPIYGDGRQMRDYVFIDDTVSALMAVGLPGETDGEAYNLGSGVGTPLVDMARAIQRVVGTGTIEFVAWPPLERQIETGDFVADVSRLTRDTGWRPLVAIEDGLRRTVAAAPR
jgi:nucleoside-diphosphate-sugar epimerase